MGGRKGLGSLPDEKPRMYQSASETMRGYTGYSQPLPPSGTEEGVGSAEDRRNMTHSDL